MGDILLDPKLYSKALTKQTGKHSVTAQCDRVLIELCLSEVLLTLATHLASRTIQN
jgi:hypothetical protein